MSEEIQNRIDEASSKEKLEAIGRELEPEIELDRRKTMDVLRAELHAHLDEHSNEASEPEPGKADDKGEPEPDEPVAAPLSDKPARPKYKGRLIQNTRTGAFFPYTAALAKKRHMREV